MVCKSRSTNIVFFYVEFSLVQPDGSVVYFHDLNADEVNALKDVDANEINEAEMEFRTLSSPIRGSANSNSLDP